MRAAIVSVLAALALGVAACGGGSSSTSASRHSAASASAPAPATPIHVSRTDPVIAAAGDIACPRSYGVSAVECHQAVTALIVGRLRPAAVLAVGDDQYETGSLMDFQSGYAASWGRFNAVVRPAPGNHEYDSGDAGGYFAYFGSRAGPAGLGYYSYDVGRWHLISLNSNCSKVSCGAGSPQVRWLRADLAAHRSLCTLAYWHHPRFSSGLHGDQPQVAPLWQALSAGGADVVVSGHDHDYERFAPQTPSGRADPRRGIREFVVGTGGRSHYPFLVPRANSQRRTGTTFGVLALTLHRDGYTWRFVPEPGTTFNDRGSGRCH